MRTGSGCGDTPVVKNESTKSSKVRANTSSPDERIAGQSAGSVTSRSAPSRVAPRSIAASSCSRLSAASRARTTTVTYEIENVICASITVSSDSLKLSCVKSKSAETPATISGVTSGTSMRMLAAGLQRVRDRTRPNASEVPSAVAMIIVTVEISRLAISDLRSDASLKNSLYQRRLKPSKTASDLVELNENSATTTIGANSST